MSLKRSLNRLEHIQAKEDIDPIDAWVRFASFCGSWDASVTPPRIGYQVDWRYAVVAQREALERGLRFSLDDERRNSAAWQRDRRARHELADLGLIELQGNARCKPSFGPYCRLMDALGIEIYYSSVLAVLMNRQADTRSGCRYFAESFLHGSDLSPRELDAIVIPLLTAGICRTESTGSGELVIQVVGEWDEAIEQSIAVATMPFMAEETLEQLKKAYSASYTATRDRIENTELEGAEIFIPWPSSHGLKPVE